jgi:hypothetical protein
MMRLEAKSDQASKKFIVVGDEAEHDALVKAGRVSAEMTVIITGVPRAARPESMKTPPILGWMCEVHLNRRA